MSVSRTPSLNLIANGPSFPNKNYFFSQIEKSVKGGVTSVQFRDLESDPNACIETAKRLKDMLGDVPLFINTRNIIEVAKAVSASGVYLEKPFPISEARKELGSKAIIGIPVTTINDVLEGRVNYLSVKVFASKKTNPKDNLLWGIEGLQRIYKISRRLPVFGVGGINQDNAAAICRVLHPTDTIAIAGALMDAENPELAAREIIAIRQGVKHD